MSTFKTISPVDGTVLAARNYAAPNEVEAALQKAKAAQTVWQEKPLKERVTIVSRFLEYFEKNKEQIALEISQQMGRPIQFSQGEIAGLKQRASYMLAIAQESLSNLKIPEEDNLIRVIQKVPVGTVLVIAPWNYPYLTAVNAIIPALIAGNSVILKHASQTPLCAERFARSFEHAGLPEGIFQYLHLTHQAAEEMVADERINAVAFTGSVSAGKKIKQAAVNRFIQVNLELGGKDPAYVRADANLEKTVPNLVEGVFFNSGQSCCGIERIYVDAKIFDEFVKQFVASTKELIIGDPLDPKTTMGPLIKESAAKAVIAQVDEAVNLGAKKLIDGNEFTNVPHHKNYLTPQVLVNVNHDMQLMTEENFGPVVGIMAVNSDEQAVELMNDSRYGLTASIWSEDLNQSLKLCNQIETGTCFVNRCDYLDPALAWTGVKDTGVGCSLSAFGFAAFTRYKSIHIRKW